MFLNNGEKSCVYIANEFRHDLLLHFSEDYLFDGTDRTSTSAYVETPYPIHKPLVASIKATDIVQQLLEEKSKYSKLLEAKRKKYKSGKKAIIRKKIANHEYVYLPRHLLEFYRNKDPDVYFNCDYNFYYTGGVLDHLQINNSDYLIRPDAERNLCLNNLREPSEVIKIRSNCSSPIFNITSCKKSGDYLLVLREKHDVSIANLSDINNINKIWTSKYDVPVLDAKLNQSKPIHLGEIQSNLSVSVRDFQKDKTVYTFRNNDKRDADNFQHFQFLNENAIILIDRFIVKLIDYRAKNEVKVFDPKLIKCNSLCGFKTLNNNLLLATRHYIMKTDLRMLGKASHFSHSLRTPPCYMDYATRGEDTFLCLAGQNQDSKVLFTGKSVYSLPYKVPGILDTLTECRLKSPKLAFIDNLDERLNFSTAGLKVVNLDDDIFIYWANCLGELFQQRISEVQPNIEEPRGILLDWIETIEKPEPVLYLTNVEEMSRARFALNTEPIEKNLKKYSVKSKADEFLKEFAPRYSKKNVVSESAKHFLSIWDDDEDEEEDVDELPEVPSHDKVNSWIQTHHFENLKESLLGPTTSKQ